MKKLFDHSSERLFQSSLDAIQSCSGNQELAAPLADHRYSGELEAARWLVARQESLEPRQGFLSASRKRVIEAIEMEQIRRPALRSVFNFLNARPVHQFVLAMLILALFLTGNTAVQAADISIPGDTVYPVKLVLEKAQLAVSLNKNQAAQLQILFSQRRLSELQSTILEGRYEYIPGVSDAFQEEISLAVASLDQLSDSDQQKVYQLMTGFNKTLNVQTLTLAAFTTMIPTQERGRVVAAIDASSQGTQVMQDMMAKY